MLKNLLNLLIFWVLAPSTFSFRSFPWIIGGVGFTMTLLLYFPGGWHYDASVQHAQAASGLYGDWHPPVIVASLRCANGMFNAVFHTNYSHMGVLFTLYALLFWSGVASVLAASQPFWKQLEGNPRLFTFIPIGIILAVLCSDIFFWARGASKDLGMLGSYLLALGMLLNWSESKKRQIGFSIAILCFLAYGTSLRHNAIFALLPLVTWLVWLLCTKKSMLRNSPQIKLSNCSFTTTVRLLFFTFPLPVLEQIYAS